MAEGLKRSLILKYFTKEDYVELYRISLCDVDNNDRSLLVKQYFTERGIPFSPLGNGTNRAGFLIDGYAFKIALDRDGRIDNRKEMLYSKMLQPDVVKVYECTPDGTICVTEYISIFTQWDFKSRQEEMREILERISNSLLIGDIGITDKNYVNWGKRKDGSIAILDFAYAYDVKFNIFQCTCEDEALLKFDKNYVNLICPVCGKKFTFGDIRRRISMKQHEEEIGDIRRVGYCLTKPEQMVELVPEFEPQVENKNAKKKHSFEKRVMKNYRRKKKLEKQGLLPDYWDVYDADSEFSVSYEDETEATS